MTKAEKKFVLQRIYDASEKVLLSPENPFTLDNPDVIVSRGNRLFAVFIPTYRENANMDHLLRRLCVSQLSYGYYLIPVLIVQEKESIEILNNIVINQLFTHVTTSVEDLLSFINQYGKEYHRSKLFSKIQCESFLSYRQNLALSEIVNRELRTDFSAADLVFEDHIEYRSWSTDRIKQSSLFNRMQFGFIATYEKKQSVSFKTSFEQLMTLVFMSRFKYDNGFYYPNPQVFDSMSIMNTNWTMFDNEKSPNNYNRMLSFIGVAPVEVSTDRDLALVYDKYQIIKNHVIA